MRDVVESLTRDLKPVRRAPPPWLLAGLWALASSALLIPFTLLVFGARGDLTEMTARPLFLGALLCLFLTFFSAARLGLVLAIPGRRVGFWDRGLPYVSLVGFTVLLAIPHETHAAHGLNCTLTLVALSVLPGVLLAWLARRFAVIAPGNAASAIGIAMGAVAALALSLHCPSRDASHLVVFHALPVFALGIVVGLGLRRWLRW